jgi:ABC-type sugar transport system ATPase subunit
VDQIAAGGAAPLVELRGIAKTFGSTKALRGVDFSVMRGEIHALLGRNGAGKSTLVSALSGYTPADAGRIRVGDIVIEANGQDYAALIRQVVAHVQQTPKIFNQLSVAENLFLEHPAVRNRFGFVSYRRMTARASELLQKWKIDIRTDAQAGALGAGTRQLLEIVKALNRHVPVIILDEPTAALSNTEKRVLFDQVKGLRERGVSIVYISHHLDEVFEIADVVTVLRDGQAVRERAPVTELDVQMLAALMMGEKTVRSSREDYTRPREAPLLRARGLRLEDADDPPIDLDIQPGEIVALAGPVGGGKESLAMILAGQQEPAAGTLDSPRPVPPTIGLVPTDRHASGYVGLLGVRENVALGGLDRLSNELGFIMRARETEHVADLARRTQVIASSLDQPVAQLSGGNQQKVVFARALCRDPQIIVALSPTRGVDVGAKEQLYALLRQLASKGMGVVVVSDEEDEIDQLANRVIIVVGREVVDVLSGQYRMEDLILRMEGVS